MDWLVNFGHVSAVDLHFSERIWLQNLELIETYLFTVGDRRIDTVLQRGAEDRDRCL